MGGCAECGYLLRDEEKYDLVVVLSAVICCDVEYAWVLFVGSVFYLMMVV